MDNDRWSDNPKAKADKRRRQIVSGSGGKGDKPRTNTQSESYQLGIKLGGLDIGTPEYEETLAAWRKAMQPRRI